MPLTVDDIASTPAALIDELNRASRVSILTGAGVSAESGIPTFRDAHRGMWAKHDPMALASPQGFERDPATVWKWYQWRRALIAASRPNPGHQALAQMQQHHASVTLITQNVDGFHQLAGSEQVLELHGNIHRNICSVTRKPIDADWIEKHADHHPPPSPHHQRGLARPDVVWFGESLDETVLESAFTATSKCELMMVIGTAGAVQPAASLPVIARQAGACVIEINPDTTELTRLVDWRLNGASASWLPALVDKLGSTA